MSTSSLILCLLVLAGTVAVAAAFPVWFVIGVCGVLALWTGWYAAHG